MIKLFDENVLKGKTFKTSVGTEWVCIGVAAHPSESIFFVVGMQNDPNGGSATSLKTFKLNEVTFQGPLTI